MVTMLHCSKRHGGTGRKGEKETCWSKEAWQLRAQQPVPNRCHEMPKKQARKSRKPRPRTGAWGASLAEILSASGVLAVASWFGRLSECAFWVSRCRFLFDYFSTQASLCNRHHNCEWLASPSAVLHHHPFISGGPQHFEPGQERLWEANGNFFQVVDSPVAWGFRPTRNRQAALHTCQQQSSQRER